MSMRFAGVVVLGCTVVAGGGCGSVDAGVHDARIDSPGADAAAGDAIEKPCDLTKPFGAPIPVMAVNTAQEDQSARLSADEKTMYLASRPANTSLIYTSTRADLQSAWSMPNPLTSVNNGDMFSPTVTDDGLTMYLISNGTGTVGGHDVFVSMRANTVQSFPTPTDVANINSSNDIEYSVSVTGDGNDLYFSSARNGTERVWHSAKSQSGFGSPGIVTDIQGTNGYETTPAIRADGLELYFGSDRTGGAGSVDIWVARRQSRTAPFGTPMNVTELNATGAEWPTWISADGCRMLLQSDRPGGKGNTDIWFAQRPK